MMPPMRKNVLTVRFSVRQSPDALIICPKGNSKRSGFQMDHYLKTASFAVPCCKHTFVRERLQTNESGAENRLSAPV